MPDSVTVKVEGFAELERAFRTAPPKIARSILRRAMRPAATVFRDEMVARARRRTGFLADHIGMRISMSSDELAATARVGPDRTAYPLAEFAAFLKSQGLKAGRGTISKMFSRGTTVAMVARFLEFGTRKMHAFPFIRQAFESRKIAALDTFTAAAKAGFEEGKR